MASSHKKSKEQAGVQLKKLSSSSKPKTKLQVKRRTSNYKRLEKHQPKRPPYQFTASKRKAYATSLGFHSVRQNALGIWRTPLL